METKTKDKFKNFGTNSLKFLAVAGAISSGIYALTHIKGWVAQAVDGMVHDSVYHPDFKPIFNKAVDEAVQHYVESIEGGYKYLHTLHIQDSLAFVNYTQEDSRTFAVGLRVERETNLLYYRAENGILYRAYKDHQMSQTFNYPYFYYIDHLESNKKKWCK